MPLSHSLRGAAAAFLLTLFAMLATAAAAGERLQALRERGVLSCGVADNQPGYANRLPDGRYVGFEADLCRGIAAALFGDGERVRFLAIDSVHDFLADERIDLAFHRLSWTLTREAPGQLEFGPITLHDEPESTVKEPLAPLLRSDDPDLLRIVRWTIFALIEAEELGITQSSQPKDWPPEETADSLSLPPDWARRAVATVGNYGEIYARHFGHGSATSMPRGLNRLPRDGGILYAPPLR
jgi:ABC-type amino acid transport substrate-binding protein